MEFIEINENEHFTVDRDTDWDTDLYMCNFCPKVIKTPMGVRLCSLGSIWCHLKYMHPNKIKNANVGTYLNR